MKWFLIIVLVLNLLTGLYGWVKQKPPVVIGEQDVNATQLKVLPAGWAPPVVALAPLMVDTSAATALPTNLDSTAPVVASATVAAPAPLVASAVKAVPPLASAVTPLLKVPTAPPAAADKATVAVAAMQCYRWGAFDERQLPRVEGGIPLLKLAQAPQRSVSEEKRGSGKAWVFYPPLATQAETQTLVAELKGKGFDSYIVRTDGPFKGHLSLGLFAREAAAQELVKKLKAAGYTKAEVDARSTPAKLTTLTFAKLDDASADKLKALQKRLFPGIPVQRC